MRKIICACRQLQEDIYKNRMALFVLLCYIIITQSIWGTVCPMLIMTSLPCPACGLTRAGISVLTGHLNRAWKYNPMIFLWIAMIIWWFVQRYFIDASAGEGKMSTRDRKHPVFVFCMIICCFLTIALYFIRIKNSLLVK